MKSTSRQPWRTLLVLAASLLAWSAPAADDPAMARKADWWTFKKPIRPEVPSVRNRAWTRNPIDNFIAARHEAENLSPARPADRGTLIRRLTLDLWGLVPDTKQVQEFERTQDPDATAHLIDDLLASPHYGERWARHWLDVVHFGETHGYDKDKPRQNAWPYRDYVIRSLNADKPWSRFVEEQLAGDVLFPEDPQGVVATGFISAGPWDFVGHVELPITKTDGLIARYNDRDDMLATAMTSFESLTVHCARCHDHKFDPISQKEYYAIQAVFAGVDRADRSYDADPAVFQKRQALLKKKKTLVERQTAVAGCLAKITNAALSELDAQIKVKETALKQLPKNSSGSPSNGYHSNVSSQQDTTKWVEIDLGREVLIDRVILIPARPTDFADTPGFGFPKRFRVEAFLEQKSLIVTDHSNGDFANPGDSPVALKVAQPVRRIRVTAVRLWERSADYVFALGELQAFSGTNNLAVGARVTALDSIEAGRWSKGALVDGFDSRKGVRGLDLAQVQSERQSLTRELTELKTAREKVLNESLEPDLRRERSVVQSALATIENSEKSLPPAQWTFAAASDFAPSGNFQPAKIPRLVHLLRRGDVKSPQEEMIPAALKCLATLPGELSVTDLQNEGLRRAALANWFTDQRNIQMRRSIVNRVWQYHFGKGLVDTPNDFGHMGSLPSHPELLDWLAFWFMDHGESLKELHRLILTSATYCQSVDQNERFAKIDGDNRYLWRMNRQRLDAEQFHDVLLQLSGTLDPQMGGPSVRQFYFKDDHSPVYDYTRNDLNNPGNNRRSIYRFVVRSVPDPFMESLDCPDPSILTGRRNTTLTALQALAGLNNPFVIRQAELFAKRLTGESTVAGQVALATIVAYGRIPKTAERELLEQYTTRNGLENLARLLVNTSEFMFID